jgi:hypothetical protein
VAPAFVSTAGVAFDEVIFPLLNEIVDTLFGLLGRPNCNGDVLHDTAVFLPNQPNNLTISKIYTASSVSFCGSPARTSVHLTLQRVVSVPPFSSQPPPKLDVIPSKNESPEVWFGTWAEDSYTPTPIIVVTIARSTAASGLMEVTITEHVDRRFDATFEVSNSTLSPHNQNVFIFTGNVFATVRPWLSHSLSPANLYLQFSNIRTARTPASAIRSTETTIDPLPTFRLNWNRPPQIGGGVSLSSPLKVSVEAADLSTTPSFLVQAEALEIANQGVILCLYSFRNGNTVIGHAVRYIRDTNSSFTRADVMLVPWSPLH